MNVYCATRKVIGFAFSSTNLLLSLNERVSGGRQFTEQIVLGLQKHRVVLLQATTTNMRTSGLYNPITIPLPLLSGPMTT